MLSERLCLSIHLRRTLWRKRGAVNQEGMGWQGHFVPKQGCAPSVSEKELSNKVSQMMSR